MLPVFLSCGPVCPVLPLTVYMKAVRVCVCCVCWRESVLLQVTVSVGGACV